MNIDPVLLSAEPSGKGAPSSITLKTPINEDALDKIEKNISSFDEIIQKNIDKKHQNSSDSVDSEEIEDNLDKDDTEILIGANVEENNEDPIDSFTQSVVKNDLFQTLDTETQDPMTISVKAAEAVEEQVEPDLSGNILQADGKILPGQLVNPNQVGFSHNSINTDGLNLKEISPQENTLAHTEDILSSSNTTGLLQNDKNTSLNFHPGNNEQNSTNHRISSDSIVLDKSLNNIPTLLDSKLMNPEHILFSTQQESDIPQTKLVSPIDLRSVSLISNLDTYKTTSLQNSNNIDPQLSLDIKPPAGSMDWNIQVTERIQWMNKLNLSTAKIKLHPVELGPLEIRIFTEDDQTKVSFVTTTQAAKETIEASMPKLRDMLNSNGLQLEQSDVSHQKSQNNNQDQQHEQTSTIPLTNMNVVNTVNSQGQNKTNTNQVDHYV